MTAVHTMFLLGFNTALIAAVPHPTKGSCWMLSSVNLTFASAGCNMCKYWICHKCSLKWTTPHLIPMVFEGFWGLWMFWDSPCYHQRSKWPVRRSSEFIHYPKIREKYSQCPSRMSSQLQLNCLDQTISIRGRQLLPTCIMKIHEVQM